MNQAIKKPSILLAAIIAGSLIFIGIALALSFEIIRYTKYVEPKMVEISPKDAYQEMLKAGTGNYLFIDVRTIAEYNNLHASSSISKPIADLYNEWRNGLPRKDKEIYIICTSGRLAAIAYGYLQLHGYRNIKHVTGGISHWVHEGQPVVAKDVFR